MGATQTTLENYRELKEREVLVHREGFTKLGPLDTKSHTEYYRELKEREVLVHRAGYGS